MDQIETQLDDVHKGKLTYKYMALIPAALGTFMGTVDVSITNIAFPTLTGVFNTQLSTVMWVALAYNLTATSLLLTLGRAADQWGHKRLFAIGISIFTLGLILCSACQSITQLIVCRVIQAAGGAMTMACSQAIVTDAFPGAERGKGLGLLGASVSAGFITGPILGGLLLEWFQWRSIFYLRVPLGILVFILSLIILRKDEVMNRGLKFDVWGMLTSSIGFFCIMFGISQLHKTGSVSTVIHSLIGFGVLCVVSFIIIERRVSDPIVDLSLFKPKFLLEMLTIRP